MQSVEQIKDELANQKKQLSKTILDKQKSSPDTGTMEEQMFDDRIAQFRESIETLKWVLS